MQCETVLRTGRCEMDGGHRGRHTTVAFFCDECQKMRRGRPYTHGGQRMSDGTFEVAADFCWFCIEVKYGPRGWGRINHEFA